MQAMCGYLVLACLLSVIPVACVWGLEGVKWWGIFWGFTLGMATILRDHGAKLGIETGLGLLMVLLYILLVPTLVVAIAFHGGEGFRWWGICWGFTMSLVSFFWCNAQCRR